MVKNLPRPKDEPRCGYDGKKCPQDQNSLGAKYLGFFSSRSLKMREKYISFAQFVYFLREVRLLYNF